MIRDFIQPYMKPTTVFHEGDYGVEIETESLTTYKFPRQTHDAGGYSLGGKNDMTFWDVKGDGSLRHYGLEYVLKVPLSIKDAETALEEFKDKTKKIEFLQDSNSTSVHVHKNFLHESWRTLANFFTIWTMAENLLIEYSGEFRRNNLFCLPIRSVPYVNTLMIQMMERVAKKNYNCSSLLSLEHIKYSAINLSTLYRIGSIELRPFRGTTDTKLIMDWVTLIHMMVEFSRRDITPFEIMDAVKENGISLLKDVFGTQGYKLLKHKDEKELFYRNLISAGRLGYCMTSAEWNKLDALPKPKNKKNPTKTQLDKWAMDLYGKVYSQLTPAQAQYAHGVASFSMGNDDPAPQPVHSHLEDIMEDMD